MAEVDVEDIAADCVSAHVRYDIDREGNLTILDPTGRAAKFLIVTARKNGFIITPESAAAFIAAEIRRRISAYNDKARTKCDRHLTVVKDGE